MIKVADVIGALEAFAPLSLQETWDNTGLQVGHRDAPVSGVLTVVDVTPERVDEAVAAGVNMIVSHHPLIFKGLRSLTDDNQVQRAVEKALKNDIAVYSSHTALDNAENGVSYEMAARLGARVVAPLVPLAPAATTGCGVVAQLPRAVTPRQFIDTVKEVFGNTTVRCTDPALCRHEVSRIALCGGAGGGFIDNAVAAGADAYVTGDIRYHDFVDNAARILLVDCGHFETEALTRDIFARVLKAAFPDLRIEKSKQENNQVKYI